MATLAADLLNVIQSRSKEDREALLEYLAADYMSGEKLEVRSIQNDRKQTVGYIVPNHSSVAWQTVFGDPANIAELKKRLEQTTVKGFTLDEAIEQLRQSQ